MSSLRSCWASQSVCGTWSALGERPVRAAVFQKYSEASSKRSAPTCARRSSTVSNRELGLLDFELSFHAVELALPLVAPSLQALAHARRERLLRDEVAVALERARDGSRVAKRNPVRDVETGVLAEIVQVMRELARESFELELGSQLRLERHRRAGVASHRVAGRALMRDEDLRVRELEAFDADRPVTTLIPSVGERLPHARQVLTELRSEHLEVRLDRLFHEALGRIAQLDRLHVELVLHDLGEIRAAVERPAVAVVR